MTTTESYEAVLFDLLTGLLDSWSLWNRVAGDDHIGRLWRASYLDIAYREGRYRPYEDLVASAADHVGLPATAASELVARWDELEAWPETETALRSLAPRPLGIVTNCSDELARRAVARLGLSPAVVVSAERAGWYKPAPQAYRQALAELGLDARRVLYVAGSAHDVIGASDVGLPVVWHNRIGVSDAAAGARARAVIGDLRVLPAHLDRADQVHDGMAS